MAQKIKVLIVDDSAIIRQAFNRILSSDPNIEVVGLAPDPFVARDMLMSKKPDVVTLDIEMPRMDGLTFLKKIMTYMPVPVIICSSLTAQGSRIAFEALQLGAVEILHKPTASFAANQVGSVLARAIRTAALVKVKKLSAQPKSSTPAKTLVSSALSDTTNKVIVIGASTGGTAAVETILKRMPPNAPGCIVVQHMPAGITTSFAQRLDTQCAMEVREAKSGDPVVPGLALIAPGDKHLILRRSGGRYFVQVKDGPQINYHRPSIDLTLKSVARSAGTNAVGVILTGMGADGAKGLLDMRKAGARTIAQDEATSVVYGMPKVAAELKACEIVLPINDIAGAILQRLSGLGKETAGKAA